MTAPVLPDVDFETWLSQQLVCEFAEYQTVGGRLAPGAEPSLCSRPAEWRLRTTCPCGAADSALVCNVHHDAAIQPSAPLICSACHVCGPPATITAERL